MGGGPSSCYESGRPGEVRNRETPQLVPGGNGDFRYRMTSIGQDAHDWISAKVHNVR